MAAGWTQADVDRLRAAMAGSAVIQSMSFQGQSFTFRSMEDMRKLLGEMVAEVDAAAGVATTHRYASVNSGL